MNGDEAARRLIAELKSSAKLRGRGTLTRAIRDCSLSDDYLNTDASRIPLGQYLDLVNAAGFESLQLSTRALDEDDPVSGFIAKARRIRRDNGMPHLLRQARRQAAIHRPNADGGFDLEAIDDRRYHDVDDAARQAAHAVRAARGPAPVARALGAWASCQRMRYRLDWASGALGLAVEIADTAQLPAVTTEVLQRASALLKDRGDFELALRVARGVASSFLLQGDLQKFGHALVDWAVVLTNAKDLETAAKMARLALEPLAETSPRHLATAFHIISQSLVSKQQLADAEIAAENAAHWAESCGPHFLGRIAWLQAHIAVHQGKIVRAEERYFHTLEFLSDGAWDAVLAGTELVRLLLHASKPGEAQETAASMSWFREGLETRPSSRLAPYSAALDEVIRAGEERRLNLEMIEKLLPVIGGL